MSLDRRRFLESLFGKALLATGTIVVAKATVGAVPPPEPPGDVEERARRLRELSEQSANSETQGESEEDSCFTSGAFRNSAGFRNGSGGGAFRNSAFGNGGGGGGGFRNTGFANGGGGGAGFRNGAFANGGGGGGGGFRNGAFRNF